MPLSFRMTVEKLLLVVCSGNLGPSFSSLVFGKALQMQSTLFATWQSEFFLVLKSQVSERAKGTGTPEVLPYCCLFVDRSSELTDNMLLTSERVVKSTWVSYCNSAD